MDRSVKFLDKTQQSQTFDLLTRFADVFSRNSDDLGRTNLVQHRINTEGAAAIRQPARRLPILQRNEAEKKEKRKVIAPSASPWASPVRTRDLKESIVRREERVKGKKTEHYSS